MTDKQITSNDYIFELNEMCIDCISEIDECECRKPKLGLFYQAQKDYDIDFSKIDLEWFYEEDDYGFNLYLNGEYNSYNFSVQIERFKLDNI
mgnify:CR=1 FL=1